MSIHVLCSFAYFFFPNLQRALSEFFRVLRPHGKLAVTLSGGNDEHWRWYEELLHTYHNTYQIPLSSPGGSGHCEPAQFKALLINIGFIDIESVFVETEGIYKDEQEWWAAKWTHGARYPLERMPSEVLAKFAAEVKARMAPLKQSDGFHERWKIECVLASRPFL